MPSEASAGGFVFSESNRLPRLLDAAWQENLMVKDDIAETQVSPISLIPANFGKLLSDADFRDLLGFLLEK